MNIQVSVIIPNYNHEPYLNERIDSVLNQTFQDFEIIILDDNSTDNSVKIIETYKNQEKVSNIVVNSINSGSTFKQWQKGLELAKGNFIWIAESDDAAEPDFLEKMLSPLLADSEVGLVFCQCYKYNKNGNSSATWINYFEDINYYNWEHNFIEEGENFVLNAMILKNPIINASGVVFRRSIVDRYDLLKTNMTINGDWLFYIKFLVHCKVAFISKPLNYFRNHSNNGSIKNVANYNNIKEYYMILFYIFNEFDISPIIKKLALNKAAILWVSNSNIKNYFFHKSIFFSILKASYKVDKFIFPRIFKVLFLKVLYRLKIIN